MKIQELVRDLLAKIGEDPEREGLKETPDRVARAYTEWFKGYEEDPRVHVKVFEDGGEDADQVVLVKGIPDYRHC